MNSKTPITVPDEAYNATSWNGNTEVPTKNAIRDLREAMGLSGYTLTNTSTLRTLHGDNSTISDIIDVLATVITDSPLGGGGGGSGITRSIAATSGSLTLGVAALTDYVVFVTGAHTVSMPAASGNTNKYTVKNNHSANITIDTAGAENIEGVASIQIAPGESVTIYSDGTNWWIV